MPSDSITENFTGADSASLGANWSENGETGNGIWRQANVARGLFIGAGTAINTNQLSGADLRITAKMAAETGNTCRLCFRHTGTASAYNVTGSYHIDFIPNAAARLYRGATLVKTFSGTAGALHDTPSVETTFGILVRNTAEGHVRIDLLDSADTILGTWTDTDDLRNPGGAYAGFALNSPVAGNSQVDDWTADVILNAPITLGEGGAQDALPIAASGILPMHVLTQASRHDTPLRYIQTFPRLSQTRRFWTLQWRALTGAQRDTLATFYQAMQAGLLAWTFTDPRHAGATRTAAFLPPPITVRRTGPDRYTIEAKAVQIFPDGAFALLPDQTATYATESDPCDPSWTEIDKVILTAATNEAALPTDAGAVNLQLGLGEFRIKYHRGGFSHLSDPDPHFSMEDILYSINHGTPGTAIAGLGIDELTADAYYRESLVTGRPQAASAAGNWENNTVTFWLDTGNEPTAQGTVRFSVCRDADYDPDTLDPTPDLEDGWIFDEFIDIVYPTHEATDWSDAIWKQSYSGGAAGKYRRFRYVSGGFDRGLDATGHKDLGQEGLYFALATGPGWRMLSRRAGFQFVKELEYDVRDAGIDPDDDRYWTYQVDGGSYTVAIWLVATDPATAAGTIRLASSYQTGAAVKD